MAALARQSAAELRAERLPAARAARQAGWPGAGETVPRQRRHPPPPASSAPTEPTGDRALRSPASEKRRASTLADGARAQAKRDSRQAGSR
ncbi:MAG TPA: hypothetical protein VKV35_03490 [Streptosporangiaceae bacterium]|nr:hypothetical protein [Streptosporangiaceae bacterium]